jgi:hypothetical protein
MMRRAQNWAAAAAIAALLSLSHLLGPEDIATEQAIADDLAQAVQTAQVRP